MRKQPVPASANPSASGSKADMRTTAGNPLPSTKDDYQRLLSACSLFSGDFSLDWLIDLLIGRKPSRILAYLHQGVREGWLIEKDLGTFSFKNSRKRDKWRNTLTADEKSALHGHISEMLMREFAHEDMAVRIATDHLLHIRNNLPRCRCLVKAGDAHIAAFRNEEGLRCYGKALDDLASVSGEEEDLLFSQTAIKYSKISVGRHETGKVISILQSALKRASRLESKSLLALLNMHIAKMEWIRSRYSRALKYFEEGWALTKELDEPKTTRSATVFSTFFHYWQGRFKEAIQIYEQSAQEIERYPRKGFPLLAIITAGYCYAQTGHVSQGLGMLDSIRAQCAENGNLYMGAYALANIGNILLQIGRIEDGIRFLDEASSKAFEVHNDWVWINCKIVLAYAYFIKGENEIAAGYVQEFLTRSRKVQVTVYLYPYLMEICLAMKEGRLPRIEGLDLEKEIEDTIKGENIFMKGIAWRCRAILGLMEGVPQQKIRESFENAIRFLEESGSKMELSKTLVSLARLELTLGHREKAEQLVATARDTSSAFDSGGCVPDDLKGLLKNRPVGENLLKEILRLGQQVVTLREFKDLFQNIISTVNGITGAERGAIFLLKSDSEPPKLALRASKNLTSEQIEHPHFASSMSMIQQTAETGKGRLMGINSEEDPGGFSTGIIRSRICVPMILRDKTVGVLYHDNRLLSSAFKESDLELLAYFAGQAAFALDNARAYEEINRLNDRLREENLYYKEEHHQNLHFEDIVGESAAIRRVLSQVDQVCGTDTAVMIRGETGVGKELVARAVHRHSPRRDKPFIRIHCSALPETLIASELFGHEKGAFTGASQRRIGRFELADGGTLFLDEIGEISADIQVRLLRVLQTKEFERVGSSVTLRSDFRLVVASNRDLEEAVRRERFRADLYYRLAVFPIHVPPLRDRKDDIPILAQYFLSIYSRKMGKKFLRFPSSQMDKMLNYHWPGNVRELENVIERGTILSEGPLFKVPALGAEYHDSPAEQAGATLKDNERRHILWALDKTGWKVRGKGGAAELLAIPPSTLAFRMKKVGIKRPGSE